MRLSYFLYSFGLPDKSSAPKSPQRKVTLQTVQEVKKLAGNPELGAFRVSAALEQMGIKLSPATCGRVLSMNREVYHLQVPSRGGRPKAPKPFRAERRHQFWIVDIRYLDMHRLENVEMVYCISILVWLLVVTIAIAGIPQGLASLANQNAVYYQADPKRMGASSGLLRTFTHLGALLASAANGAFLKQTADGSKRDEWFLHTLGDKHIKKSVRSDFLVLKDMKIFQKETHPSPKLCKNRRVGRF